MRFVTLTVVFVALPVLAFAQAEPCAPHRYAFDPYKPSDLAVVRQVGAGFLAQAPLSSLLQLDPYVPTEAQLLRQYGGALPVWPFAWSPVVYPQSAYPLAFSRICQSIPPVATTSFEPPITTVADLQATLERARASLGVMSGDRSVPAPPVVDRNRGVSIEYGGRTWVSAGRAVTLDASFVRVGEHAGAAVYTPRGASKDLIYVATTAGLIAPFRAIQR